MRVFVFSVLCLLGISVMTSCSADEKLNEKRKVLTEEEFVSQLKFVTLTSTPTSRAIEGNPTISPKTKTVGIFSAKIARKSKDCKRGFGLCNFKLFSTNTSIAALEASLEENEYLLEVYYDDESSNYYVELLLDQPLPEGATEEMSSLKIEEDIYWLKDEDSISDLNTALNSSTEEDDDSEEDNHPSISEGLVKVDSDTLILNPGLGVNGGYQITLQLIEQ